MAYINVLYEITEKQKDLVDWQAIWPNWQPWFYLNVDIVSQNIGQSRLYLQKKGMERIEQCDYLERSYAIVDKKHNRKNKIMLEMCS